MFLLLILGLELILIIEDNSRIIKNIDFISYIVECLALLPTCLYRYFLHPNIPNLEIYVYFLSSYNQIYFLNIYQQNDTLHRVFSPCRCIAGHCQVLLSFCSCCFCVCRLWFIGFPLLLYCFPEVFYLFPLFR